MVNSPLVRGKRGIGGGVPLGSHDVEGVGGVGCVSHFRWWFKVSW